MSKFITAAVSEASYRVFQYNDKDKCYYPVSDYIKDKILADAVTEDANAKATKDWSLLTKHALSWKPTPRERKKKEEAA